MNKPKCIISDLDGTLALLNGRDPYDASTCENDLLNAPIADILKTYNNLLGGPEIIFLSGREDKYREPTQNFLSKHGFLSHRLFMRPTDDFRKDSIIKKEILERDILPKYDVLFVLDDRDQVVDMWRDSGLTCLQVNYGNF